MSESEDNCQKIKKWVTDQGISLFGVADIGPFKNEFIHLTPQAVASFNHGIALALRLSDAVLEEIEDRPTHLYFHHYRQANFFLDRVAFSTVQLIQALGYRALPIPASQIIDWESQKGHLSHRQVAVAAGLWWMGRNNLLITPAYGARIRLVTVLTDVPLPYDHPVEGDCGACRSCIGICPAEAIKQRREEFEHLKCFDQLRLFRKRDHIGQYICGVCIKACGGNRKSASGQP